MVTKFTEIEGEIREVTRTKEWNPTLQKMTRQS